MHKADLNNPTSDFKWVKDIWSGPFSPKMRVFLWSIIQKALPFGENLQTRGMQSASQCPRCSQVETPMHAFFTCPFAAKVWELIPTTQVVHIATDTTFQDILVLFRKIVCLPPSGLSLNVLPWICWEIWTARNSLLFENRHITTEETANKGIRLAREWCAKQRRKKHSTRRITPSTKEINEYLNQQTLICARLLP